MVGVMTNPTSSAIADRIASAAAAQDLTVEAVCTIAEVLDVPVEDLLVGGAK